MTEDVAVSLAQVKLWVLSQFTAGSVGNIKVTCKFHFDGKCEPYINCSRLGSKLMFYFKWPDLASLPSAFNSDCYATIWACVGATKQAALNEFIMQKQSLKASFFSTDLVIFWSPHKRGKLNLWQSQDGNLRSLDVGPVYVFTRKLIYISIAAGKYESEGQETPVTQCSCSHYLSCTYLLRHWSAMLCLWHQRQAATLKFSFCLVVIHTHTRSVLTSNEWLW